MGWVRWTIRIHKWIALIVGLQVLFWMASGLVMTAIPIERVRGEHNIAEQTPVAIDLSAVLPPGQAAQAAGLERVTGASLRHWLGRPVYDFSAPDGPVMVDATTGARLSPISMEQALDAALADYAGDVTARAVAAFEDATWESRRDEPTWRVTLNDEDGTRLYVSQASGQVIARRTDVWRIYDFFWMLHIMDYGDRSHFNHPLVIGTTFIALIMTVSGVVLLFPWVNRMVRQRRAKAQSPDRDAV